MADKDYLNSVSPESIKEILPRRKAIIDSAPDTEPRYEYNANVLAKSLHPSRLAVKVSEVRQLVNAKLYTLIPDESRGTDALPYFRAGQYISLTLKIGDSLVTRPYSLCASPKLALEGKYQILVKNVKDGFASEFINNTFAEGTCLDVSSPQGFFYYEPLRDAPHIVGIAGGSGIAPLMSIAYAIADGIEDADLTLLYGSKTREEILFREELDSLAASCSRIRVIHVLSDEDVSEGEEGFAQGFISSGIISRFAPSSDHSYFVCGSQGMYDYIDGELAKLSVPDRRIRRDAYGQYRLSDRDKDQIDPASDKVYKIEVTSNDGITRTVPAKECETVLTAFERAGIRAPSHCRSGECGFCRSHLISGEVYAPDRVDSRRGYDVAKGYIHPCSCFPKSDLKISINYEEPKIKLRVKDMKKKERLVGLIMTIVISIAMGALATFVVLKTNAQAAEGMPHAIMYIMNILLSAVLGVIISLFIPLGKLGRGLAAKANANPPSMKFYLLNAIPMSVGNSIIIGLILSLVGVLMGRSRAPAEALAQMPPMPVMWLSSFFTILFPTLILSYVLSVLLAPFVASAVGLGGPPPQEVPAQED
ncbi:MAG: 2Fe-2S iron-sulfur cluster binding domain-containing protein [Saccharofermentans sp.]|nr:2Fe-2S iron-sulfur cluster binding domain-containing protein [Saccharofermentans sp.]